MDAFPWYASALIGLCVGVFAGFIVGLAAMQKLNDAEKKANRK